MPNLTMSLSELTVATLKDRALRMQKPYSVLADACIKHCLDNAPDAVLQKWLDSRASLGGTKAERAVLTAIENLTQEQWPAYRHTTEEIAARAALRPAVAYGALQVLHGRGVVKAITLQREPKYDRWGRQEGLIWCAVADERRSIEQAKLTTSV